MPEALRSVERVRERPGVRRVSDVRATWGVGVWVRGGGGEGGGGGVVRGVGWGRGGEGRVGEGRVG